MSTHKAGFVNIIGNPNAGKSTLLNALVGEKISIVSPKVQTTRHRIFGIVTQPGYQLVFSDTPGLLEPKYELQKAMLDFVNESLDDADVLLILISIWEKSTEWEEWIPKIKALNKPFVVLINKIDEADEKKVTDAVNLWSEKFGTKDILPVSALNKINVGKIIAAVLPFIPEAPPFFGADELTDKTERFIVSEIIREKIFQQYKEEIPYSVEVMVQEFKEDEAHPTGGQNGFVRIRADIFTERESQKAIILGKGGLAIKKLGIAARKDIEAFLQKNIFLGLTVKIRENWRKNPAALKHFGYKK